jgi:mannose-6-phosphate isomerase
VQVHPDDEYAARHHDSRGKTEAWHVLEAAAGAEVGLGFVRGISRSEAVRAARTGEIAGLLDWRSTRRGDTWLVPAGTVHAIGAGLTIAEIQEQSDITYRIYDYGRPRELHLERGFDVAELGPYAPADGRAISLGPSRQELTRCRYFRLERWQLRGSLRYSPARDDLFHLLMVVGGRGEYRGQPFGPGATWLVPARCDAETWQLDGEVLLMYASESPTSAFATQDDGGR